MTSTESIGTEMKRFTSEDLASRYRQLTSVATAHCTFTRELIGGIPPDEAGLRAFVEHHLHLIGEEAKAAVRRIQAEELGLKEVPSAEGELQERLTYGIKVFRRDEWGPWLGDWMIKACLKAAASRLGLFAAKRGTKGDIAEFGQVRAVGESLVELYPERIHLLQPVQRTDGDIPPVYQEFRGRISSPSGSTSIISQHEYVPAGTEFAFQLRWYGKSKLSEDDMLNIFAVAQVIGLGSAKAFERGKFRVDELEIG